MQEWLGSISTLVGGFFFFHIHFHLHCLWPRGLFHSFFLCEKIILGFAISFVKHFKELYQQAMLLSLYYAIGECFFFFTMAFLFPPPHFVPYRHHFLFLLNKSSSFFLFCIIQLQVPSLTIVLDILSLGNLSLYTKDKCML